MHISHLESHPSEEYHISSNIKAPKPYNAFIHRFTFPDTETRHCIKSKTNKKGFVPRKGMSKLKCAQMEVPLYYVKAAQYSRSTEFTLIGSGSPTYETNKKSFQLEVAIIGLATMCVESTLSLSSSPFSLYHYHQLVTLERGTISQIWYFECCWKPLFVTPGTTVLQ